MQPHILPVICGAWLLGVGFGNYVAPNNTFFSLVILLLSGLWFFRSNVYKLLVLFGLTLLVGTFYANSVTRDDQKNFEKWSTLDARAVTLLGSIKHVERGINKTRVIVENVLWEGEVFPGSIEVSDVDIDVLSEHQRVKITGKIKIPKQNIGNNQGHFDAPRYYAKNGVYATLLSPKIRAVSEADEASLDHLRNYLRSIIQHNVPEPSAGLYSATLLGYANDVPDAIKKNFSASGLSHLVAISGQHIALFAVLIFFISTASGASRNIAALLTLSVSVVYVCLVNYPPSGIRSVIMLSLVYFAYALGRNVQATRVLLLASALMTMFDPRIVVADLGFQLSVLAMWGLFVYYPFLSEHLGWLPDSFGFRSIFLMTSSASLTTMPIIAYSFGKVSFVGLLANLVAVPIYPLIMLFGSIILMSGWLTGVRVILAPVADFVTRIFLVIVDNSAKLPGAQYEISISYRTLLVCYFVIFIISLLISKKTRRQFIPRIVNKKLEQSEQ